MIAGVVVFCLTAFTAGGIGMALSNIRAEPRVARQRWTKFASYVAIVTLFLLCAFGGPLPSTVAVGAIVGMGVVELYRATSGRFRLMVLSVYAPLAISSLSLAWMATGSVLAFVFLVVAAFDGFSQVTGQILGRTLLVPRVSPGKTLEGAVGGSILALATAMVLRGLIGSSTAGAVVIGFSVSVCALTGDITASWVKRIGGIKDFGAIFPGHGGVLDRFDSFVVAAAVWFFWTYLQIR